MLPRTDRFIKEKCALALKIRCLLFFGIPLIYMLFLYDASESGFKKTNKSEKTISGYIVTRHLLNVVPEANAQNCTQAAILDFPSDGFTRLQRRHGFISLHCIVAVYCFLLLANVCEQYFVPAIKTICDKLEMAEDIAGATFMAAASSSPELFINCVGTFVTEGDLGVGTIVGSAVFNILAVPACCGLLAGQVVELDWWSVSRDCLMYSVAVITLILALQDDKVYWEEALILVSGYFLYIFAMYFNEGISKFLKSGWCCFNKKPRYTEISPLLQKESLISNSQKRYGQSSPDVEGIEMIPHKETDSDVDSVSMLWSWPDDKTGVCQKCLWFFTWPMSFLLWATIPDCKRHDKLTAVTFFMCIVWIGGVSYLVAWIITVIGDTIDIPDSIMGLTFLAAGTSVPEAVSSVIVTNQGHGAMGISNSIGSNTFDIMLCLGLPWLVKSLLYPAKPGENWVVINSSGLSYSAVSLLSTLIALYVSLLLNKFKLDWKIGLVCIFTYMSFLTFATLIELNIFFPVNLPVCSH